MMLFWVQWQFILLSQASGVRWAATWRRLQQSGAVRLSPSQNMPCTTDEPAASVSFARVLSMFCIDILNHAFCVNWKHPQFWRLCIQRCWRWSLLKRRLELLQGAKRAAQNVRGEPKDEFRINWKRWITLTFDLRCMKLQWNSSAVFSCVAGSTHIAWVCLMPYSHLFFISSLCVRCLYRHKPLHRGDGIGGFACAVENIHPRFLPRSPFFAKERLLIALNLINSASNSKSETQETGILFSSTWSVSNESPGFMKHRYPSPSLSHVGFVWICRSM